MMDEQSKKLAQHFVGLYKVVRLMMEQQSRTVIQVQAISDVIGTSPQFRETLEKALAVAQASQTGQLLSEGLKVIDATIQNLQNEYGPWNN
jgi:hypothetical protein